MKTNEKDEQKGSQVKSTASHNDCDCNKDQCSNDIEANVAEQAEQSQPVDKRDKYRKLKQEHDQLQKEYDDIARAGQQVAAMYEKIHGEHGELNDRYVRTVAEYDNFRRRSRDELDARYDSACADVIGAILPVADNLHRALAHVDESEQGGSLFQGLGMTLSQFDAAFAELGIEEMECTTFDPLLHHAVAHVEDENYGAGQIVEVLQRGYKKGDRVIRYAMVKVAN